MSINANEVEAGSSGNDFDRAFGSPKINSGKSALVAMYCVALLLVGGMAFALYWFLSGRSGGSDAEMLSYLSAETNVIVGADLEALNKNSKVKEVFSNFFDETREPLKELNEKLKPTGLTIDDFSRVMVGVVSDGIRDAKRTMVWRTKKPFDKAKMAEVFAHDVEQQKGEKTYFADKVGLGKVVYFPTDTLIVVTRNKHFEVLAGKELGKILLSDEMQEFVKKMSKGDAWLVVSRTAFADESLNQLDQLKGMGIPYLSADLVDAAKEAKFAGVSAHLKEENVTIAGSLVCRDKDQAQKAEAALRKEIEERRKGDLVDDRLIGAKLKELPPEIKDIANDLKKTLSVERTGSQVTVSGNCRFDDLVGGFWKMRR